MFSPRPLAYPQTRIVCVCVCVCACVCVHGCVHTAQAHQLRVFRDFGSGDGDPRSCASRRFKVLLTDGLGGCLGHVDSACVSFCFPSACCLVALMNAKIPMVPWGNLGGVAYPGGIYSSIAVVCRLFCFAGRVLSPAPPSRCRLGSEIFRLSDFCVCPWQDGTTQCQLQCTEHYDGLVYGI